MLPSPRPRYRHLPISSIWSSLDLDSRFPGRKPDSQKLYFRYVNTLFFSRSNHNPVPFWTAVVYDRPLSYGTITLARRAAPSAPSFTCSTRLFSWQTYSKSSAPPFQRRLKPPVQTLVYAPGSSTVTSYFNVLKFVRLNRSIRCN